MKTVHIVIISVLVLAAIVFAVMYTSSSEKPNCAQDPQAPGCTPTGSVVGDNCGGPGQPSCSEYCAQHPTDPDCRETES